MTTIKNTLFFIFILFYSFSAFSEQTVEEIIKERKSIFSKNYKTAKRVNSLASNGDIDEAKKLMIEMSYNYKRLLNLFPENSKSRIWNRSFAIYLGK